MTKPASVRVSVYVAVDVETAFKVFTDEIDAWYRRGPHDLYDADRCRAIRFEPGVGGRFIEVYDEDTGEGRDIAVIEEWDPPQRLVFRDKRKTVCEVMFETVGDETKVTLEHRGFERLAPRAAQHVNDFGWRVILPWYEAHVGIATVTRDDPAVRAVEGSIP